MSDDITLDSCLNYVTAMKQAVKRQYDRNINIDLSQHKSYELFKRNVTLSLQQAYQDTLIFLDQLDMSGQKRPSSPMLLNVFDGFIDEIVEYALQRHRTSCALSNFADEHKPSQAYIVEVLEQAQKDWQAFTQQVTNQLIDA